MTHDLSSESIYDHPLIAELYDTSENYTDDVELLRRLIGDSGPLDILECFSGTGRILVPLAGDGHRITGIEIAPSMAARASEKLERLGAKIVDRVTLKVRDVLDGGWGTGYDLLIIGANAFCELPSADAQAHCVEMARDALAPGGHLFIDNDDYKGNWGAGPFGRERVVFEGVGSDGAYGRWSMEGIRFDEAGAVLHSRRRWHTRSPDGHEHDVEYVSKKHPVSAGEVRVWLDQYGFETLHVFGDRHGTPHSVASERAIFWARKLD